MGDEESVAQVHVLLADDSAVVGQRLAAALSSIGGVVVHATADTVQDAIDCTGRFLPDLVILDPDLDSYRGHLVLNHVRSHHRRIKVIVFTNDNSPGNQARFLAAGAYACLDKALEFDQLRFIVMTLRA